MELSAVLRALPIFAAIALTPLVMRGLGKLFSPAQPDEFEDFRELQARNGWINAVACWLCVGGVFLPFVLFGRRLKDVGWPALGLAFGAAVVLPCLWVCIATVPRGLARYREFWRFYELRYHIGITGITVIYVPIAILGMASVLELIRRGIW